MKQADKTNDAFLLAGIAAALVIGALAGVGFVVLFNLATH